jgi:hypothetical protein
MIPVYLKTSDFAEPSDMLYFLVTASGNFLVRKTELFTSITEVRELPGLSAQGEGVRLRLPRLPRALLEQMYGFFQAVYEQWEGEAIVFLYYSPKSATYRLEAPPQTLFRYQTFLGGWRTQMRVEYGYTPRPPGFLKVGDAHSHGDLPAFFSCTDDHDDQEDGLRITLGNLDRAAPDVSVSFVVNGRRFYLKPENILEPFSVPLAPPPEWMERVTIRESKFGSSARKTEDEQTEPTSQPG